MPKLPKSTVILISSFLFVLILVFLWVFSHYSYFKNNQFHLGQPLAVVNGVALDQDDYKDHERLLNSQKRYQQKSDKTVKLFSEKEVTEDLIKVTKMEVQARKLSVYPTSTQIKEYKNEIIKNAGSLERVTAVNKSYGWTESDFERNIFISVLKTNLENVVVLWREAESVSLRFDILPVKDPDLSYYKPKAQEFLKAHQEEMGNNVPIKTIVDKLKADPAVTQVFPNAVGYRELSSNLTLRRIQRVTKANTLSQDQHILGMKVPTKAEIWC